MVWITLGVAPPHTRTAQTHRRRQRAVSYAHAGTHARYRCAQPHKRTAGRVARHAPAVGPLGHEEEGGHRRHHKADQHPHHRQRTRHVRNRATWTVLSNRPEASRFFMASTSVSISDALLQTRSGHTPWPFVGLTWRPRCSCRGRRRHRRRRRCVCSFRRPDRRGAPTLRRVASTTYAGPSAVYM
jgi:hypothetical protein